MCATNARSALLRGLFLRLGREQQRIALPPAGIRRVRCLGFCYILRVDGDDTSAAPMSGETVQKVGVLWDRPVVVAGSSG
jgi:hypothetical protein